LSCSRSRAAVRRFTRCWRCRRSRRSWSLAECSAALRSRYARARSALSDHLRGRPGPRRDSVNSSATPTE
jgi:hypothetical protein